MPRHWMTGLALGLALVGVRPVLGDAPTATFPVDPVELVRGNEVPGRENISANHYRYRYVFANEANRAAFMEHPDLYEVQLGGACARMGALSGVGRTDLYAVHDDRIYLFASEACRSTFLKGPEQLLDADEPRPRGVTAQSETRGRALIERAVEGMGGAAAVDAVSIYEERVDREVEYKGESVLTTRGIAMVFPDRVRRERTWSESKWIDVVDGDRGWFESSDGVREMHVQQRRALTRVASRYPLAILRARTRPDFIAVAAGSTNVNGTAVDLVEVHFDGTRSTLGIERETGRILSQTYRGRGPAMKLGRIERQFSDFATTGGVTLPRTTASRFDGEVMSDSPVTLTQLRVATGRADAG